MKVKIVKWSKHNKAGIANTFLKRQAFDKNADDLALQVLADIKARGNKAVAEYVKRFDGVSLKTSEFLLKKHELDNADKLVSRVFRSAIKKAHKRILSFAIAGKRKGWDISTPGGGKLGERFNPLDRVGVYIPGGSAPLASTVLMTVTLAKVAGVPEIVVCTPCAGKKKINASLIYALKIAGATEVYRVGGIQAIGMMAYGTNTIKKVQKIVGPGGAYVTSAKRRVYGHTAIDLVAGPSEIAVFADNTANPRYVTADLLSQAEHGTGLEKALLVTNSMRLAENVQKELEVQACSLPRRHAIMKVMKNNMLLVVVKTLRQGMDLCNMFAPEHLEIMVKNPGSWVNKVRSAGAIFVGKWSPESTGDFVAGPSHVLPTGGSASMFSGLTVEDFHRRSSVIAFTRTDLLKTLPVIEAFGRIEGLDAHALSARIRFEKK